jgi:hypothetical protein
MNEIIDRKVDPRILSNVQILALPHVDSSELAWSGYYNQVMLQLVSLFPRAPLRHDSNVTDSSATADDRKPDGLLSAYGRLLFVREDKREPTAKALDEAKRDLEDKHRSFQVHLYGPINQIFCMATAAHKVMFFIRDMNVLGKITPISSEMTLSTQSQAVFSKLFNIVAWAVAASELLPPSRVLDSRDQRLTQKSVFSNIPTTVTLHCDSDPPYAHKSIVVPKLQRDFLVGHVYVDSFGANAKFPYSSASFLNDAVEIENGFVTLDLKITPVG